MVRAFGQFRRGFAAESLFYAQAAVFVDAEEVGRDVAALVEIQRALQDVDGGKGTVDVLCRIGAVRFGGCEDAQRAFQFAQCHKDDSVRAFDGKRLSCFGAAILGAGIEEGHPGVLSLAA
jgi:hypothetical protein